MLSYLFSRARLCSLLLAGAALTAGSAQATVLQFAGTFTSTFNPGDGDYQGVDSFSGTWSFTFDDSVVDLGTGGFQTFVIPAITFSSTSSPGGLFIIPSLSASVTYHSLIHNLNAVSIYGDPAANLVSGSADDFDIGYGSPDDFGSVLDGYSGPGELDGFLLGRGAVAGSQTPSSSSGSYTITVAAVPEPAAFAALFGLAGLGLAAGRRRR